MEKHSKIAERLGIPEELARECGLQYYREEMKFSVDELFEKYSQAMKENDLRTKKRIYACISREAEQGNGAAANLLAVIQETEFKEENPLKTVRLLKEAAKLGYGAGYYNLAVRSIEGKYIRKDADNINQWLSEAVKKKNVGAMKLMAHYYEEGNPFLGIRRDRNRAGRLYDDLVDEMKRDESDLSYRNALYKSVLYYESYWENHGKIEEVESTLEPLFCSPGAYTKEAYLLLGRIYMGRKKSAKALELFWKAGSSGRKQIELLSCKEIDNFDRLSFFEEKATQGDLYAYKYLGDMYAEGKGCTKDYAKALECYVHAKAGDRKEECERKIEKMKYLEHCRQLFERAMEAYRTDKYELAIVKIEKLAEQEKYPDAQVFLAKMMENGHLHCAKDQKKAVQYYREAAAKNQKEAQRKLVEIYRNGLLGAGIDEEAAVYWEERLKQ